MSIDSSPVTRLAYSPSEAAEILGISRTTVYDLIQRGALPSVKINRSRRIRRDAIVAFLDSLDPNEAA